MTSIALIILLALNILWWIIIAHVVLSWLISFDVLNMRQPFVYQLYSGLQRLLEPIYGPIRRVLPDTGGIDLAPLVVIFGIYAIRIIIANNLGAVAY
ncbi:YggT family protein [Roseobacter sp. HKCCA0434]|uniref:YggT family protein n=1 Tax=Roseobacter sp. HKCCA0434 TaxID=3079297 RepID=UPI002905B69F|nr:YggT family protein [Roseobacter sp. HKCCA0434]